MSNLFKYALRVEKVELQEELLWEYPRGFLEELWSEIKYYLSKRGEVQWNLYKFLERVEKEVESRKWDIRKFRSEKNEPITNMFKRIIREIAKESNIELCNDTLSRLLNYIRNQYSAEGVLIGGVFPVEAFIRREDYNLPYDLGDGNSCFRAGGCNEGSAFWLQIEDENFNRAKLVVFHYKAGNKEGVGRCWVYTVSSHAIFATNFYSKGFDVKAGYFKYPIVRLLRLLFGLSEETRFAFNKNIDLPIYLNGDGLIIYEKSQYSQSDEIVELSKKIQSQCMICDSLTRLEDLYRIERELYYDNREVKGLIGCPQCYDYYENSERCDGCGEYFHREELTYHEEGYWCEDCFNDRFAECCICGEYYWKDDMIIDRYGDWLCQGCAQEHRKYCEVCGEWLYFDEVTECEMYLANIGIRTVYVCEDCQDKISKVKCECCGKEYYYSMHDYKWSEIVRDMVRLNLCDECYDQRKRDAYEMAFGNKEHSSLISCSDCDPVERVLREILAE